MGLPDEVPKGSVYASFNCYMNTVKTPVSGHPREAEKVSATGAGYLWKCVNTEFV